MPSHDDQLAVEGSVPLGEQGSRPEGDRASSSSRPAPHTVVEVTALPPCDFCQIHRDVITSAEYDFQTRYGPWAHGCAEHWEVHRRHTGLGLGKGQRLVVR